jgi:hypothetical protein
MNYIPNQRYRLWFPGDDGNGPGWLFTYISQHADQNGRIDYCFHDMGQVEMSISAADLANCRVEAVN